VGGDHYYRNHRLFDLDDVKQIEPAEIGEFDIEKHDADKSGTQDLEGIRAVGRRLDIKTLARKDNGQELGHAFEVVDYQYSSGVQHHLTGKSQ